MGKTFRQALAGWPLITAVLWQQYIIQPFDKNS
jgi:hypothetical protein